MHSIGIAFKDAVITILVFNVIILVVFVIALWAIGE